MLKLLLEYHDFSWFSPELGPQYWTSSNLLQRNGAMGWVVSSVRDTNERWLPTDHPTSRHKSPTAFAVPGSRRRPPSSWWMHPSVVFPAGNDSNTNGCVILWVCVCICGKLTKSQTLQRWKSAVGVCVCLFGREVVQKMIHRPEWIIGWTRIEFPVCWLIFFETFTFYRPWHEQGHWIVRVTSNINKLLVQVVSLVVISKFIWIINGILHHYLIKEHCSNTWNLIFFFEK